MKRFEPWRIILIIIILIGATYGTYAIFKDEYKKNEPPTIQTDNEISPSEVTEITPAEITQEPEPEIKSEVLLNVPFTSQAPYADWDELHNEACEEASVIITAHYLDGDKQANIPAAEAEGEIQNMVSWEIKKLGSHRDLSAEETVNYLAKEYLSFDNAQVYTDFSRDNIKKELSDGKPVIVPAAGRLLGNPYFKQPGPVYHMLVIIGYDNNNYITNDVGTKRGREYKYPYEQLENAVHDWNGTPDNINSGQKVYITLN